jgi:acyl carrier protein
MVIWTDVLGRTVSSTAENFFELGGHSLIAMRIIHRVREVFNVDIPIRDLFVSPTLFDFAATVDRACAAGESAPSVLTPIDREQLRID